MPKTIDVLDLRVERIIQRKARKVYDVPLDTADIEQELRMAVIDYCNATPAPQRKLSAVTVVINQKLYKIIREHSKFEGCCESSRETRRNLNRPFSLNQPVITKTRSYSDDKNETMLVCLLHSNVDNQADQLTLRDFVHRFSERLNDTERQIFTLMLDGVNKPRFVCEELYGHREEKTRKTISKHMVNIKDKFRKAWSNDYGKAIHV